MAFKIMGRIKQCIKLFLNAVDYIRLGGAKIEPVSFSLPSEQYNGKRVLVTGGTTGIGFEIAKEFLSEGATVIITARRVDRLSRAKDSLNSSRLHTLVWDIEDVENCEAKLNEALNIIGDIDIFINNAGIYRFNKWDTCSESIFDEVCNINAKGLFFICEAEKNYLLKSKRKAKIINICSRNSIDSGFDPYTISKWEAACITRTLDTELFEKGIIVNGIAPGNVATNIHGDNVHDVSENAYMPSHLTQRWVLKEEIASLALFLASDRINHCHGQIIAADGGWTLH